MRRQRLAQSCADLRSRAHARMQVGVATLRPLLPLPGSTPTSWVGQPPTSWIGWEGETRPGPVGHNNNACPPRRYGAAGAERVGAAGGLAPGRPGRAVRKQVWRFAHGLRSSGTAELQRSARTGAAHWHHRSRQSACIGCMGADERAGTSWHGWARSRRQPCCKRAVPHLLRRPRPPRLWSCWRAGPLGAARASCAAGPP